MSLTVDHGGSLLVKSETPFMCCGGATWVPVHATLAQFTMRTVSGADYKGASYDKSLILSGKSVVEVTPETGRPYVLTLARFDSETRSSRKFDCKTADNLDGWMGAFEKIITVGSSFNFSSASPEGTVKAGPKTPASARVASPASASSSARGKTPVTPSPRKGAMFSSAMGLLDQFAFRESNGGSAASNFRVSKPARARWNSALLSVVRGVLDARTERLGYSMQTIPAHVRCF